MIFKRPWQVIPLLLIILAFTVYAWARVWNGSQLLDYLSELPLSVSPWYLVISGAVWGISGLVGVVMIWWGKPNTPLVVIIGAVAYSLNFWIEQLFLMVSPLREVNWPFVIGLNFILVMFIALTFRQPGVGEFYGGSHEQEIQP